MSRRRIAQLLVAAAVALAPGARAQVSQAGSATAATKAGAVRAYVARVPHLAMLRVAVNGETYEGLLDTMTIDRFTLSTWSGSGLNYRELMPVAKVPYALVDTIWTRRAGVPGGIARGIAIGALTGLALGLVDPPRTCPLDECRRFQSAVAGISVGVLAGGAIGGVIGATRRGWKPGYP